MEKKRMNILAFSWRGPKHPQAGGAEQVVHEHMKGWIAAGHRVTLFCSSFKGGRGEEIVDGVKIIRRSFQYLGVQTAAFFWYLFGKHEQFDLVIDQFHGIPFFTPLYVRVAKLAILQEVTRKVWLKNHLPFPFNFIVGWIGYLGEPLVFSLYRQISFMVGSDSAKRDLLLMGIPKSNITVVPHGVLIRKLRYLPHKEKVITVIFLGVVTKDKGIEDAIRVFGILNKKGSYQFWIVGKVVPKYKKDLLRLARSCEVLEAIKFFGFVDEKTKFNLLARAHALINPSILEGFGLVNIEANAMSTPVVAYSSPGLIDSVKDNVSGILCKENTPECLASEIVRLMSRPRFYRKLREGALKWSKQFNWQKSKKLSLALIDRSI